MQLKYCISIWTVQLLYTICIDLTALQTTHDYTPDKKKKIHNIHTNALHHTL